MKRKLLLFLLFGLILGLCFTPCFSKNIKQGNKLVIGETFSINSKILSEERPIWLYLPGDYEKSKESYPVFYLLDGDIHFHHVSGIIEVLSKFAHMPKMILVAIPNVNRERDFLPSQENNWPPTAAADKFHAFLKKELIPFIDKKYRTRPFRILSGHSHGGLFSVYAFLRDPDLFTVFISISPTMSWDNRLLVKKGEQILKNADYNHKFLFITISGDDEGAIPATREFAALLKKNAPKGLQWRCDFMEKDDHMSVVHPSIYNALRWLHRDWRLWETQLEEMTLAEVKLHYEKLSRRYGAPVPVPDGVLFNLGYSLLDHGKADEAVEAFKYDIELYPDSAAGYAGLGDVYYETGKLELAKKYYEMGLKVAEKNNDTMILASIRELLKQISKKTKKK